MVWFWSVCLFQLLNSISRTTSENSFLQRISSGFLPKEDKLAESLEVIFRDPTMHSMINVRIHIDAESEIFRIQFEDTVGRFCASNDRVTVELNSDESTAYNIHVRIYFIDSLKSLESLEFLINLQREKDRDFSAGNQNYLIILPTDVPNPELIMEQIFQVCWKNFIINVNVLVESPNTSVTLYTYYPFNENGCSDSTPRIHNRFVNGSLEWSKPTFPSKTGNFWQCPLKAVLWHEPPFVILDTEEISGLDGVVLNTLARDLNFSLEIVVSPEGKGVNYPNGTSTGAFKLLQDRMGDFTMGGISIIKSRQEYFSATNAYFMSNVWIVIKRLEEYSPLEILLFPFDLFTWLILLMLLIGNWIGRVLWKWITTSTTPFWDYSVKLRLFAWLLTILILRSSYEGSIFEFLHNRPTKAPPNNLDESIEAGYTFVVWPSAYYFFSYIPELQDKMLKIDAPKTEIFELFTTLEGKYAVFVWLDILSQYKNDSSKFEEYYVVREPVMSVYPCVYLPKFSYLTRELDRRLQQMVTHGRVNKIIDKVASLDSLMRKKPVDKRPRSLSLRELLGTYQVFGVLIGASACVFLLELLSRRNATLRRIMEFLW